jgi:hypothetical protein
MADQRTTEERLTDIEMAIKVNLKLIEQEQENRIKDVKDLIRMNESCSRQVNLMASSINTTVWICSTVAIAACVMAIASLMK